jgi:hypothetical protein
MSENTEIKTVTFYDSWVTVADCLTDEQKGQFYSAIMHYALYGEQPNLKAPMDAFFTLVQPIVDKSNSRKKAGSNGGKSKGSSNAESNSGSKTQANAEANGEAKSKQADKQNASNGSSNVKEKEKEKEKEKVKENNSLTRVIACECEEIAKIYPKEKIGDFRQVVEAVSRAVQREIDRGSSEADALAIVKLGTIAYAGAAAKMKHKRYIVQAVKFFDNGIYNNDPATWNGIGEESKTGKTSGGYDWKNPDTWGEEEIREDE